MNLKSLINTARTAEIPLAQRHAAFGQLVRHYQAMVYATASTILDDKQLAEEAVQEAFITAYQKLPQLREPDAFPGWIKQIGRNAALRLVRGKSLPTASIDSAHDIPISEADPALKAEVSDLREQVLTAVEALPDHERSVVELFYIQGYSQREVADVLTLPLTTVKKRLQYARQRLRETMVELYSPTLSIASPQRADFADVVLEIGFVLLETRPLSSLIWLLPASHRYLVGQAQPVQFFC
ncbi:MAG: sigma-70 family RNA polymerase sigma factor [Anaerolineae bacterium]|nr:sigma-70 family RNA polymerase sigma factor [Anaerolineae bacterium]